MKWHTSQIIINRRALTVLLGNQYAPQQEVEYVRTVRRDYFMKVHAEPNRVHCGLRKIAIASDAAACAL
jgi:hypothetical protein